MFEVEVWVIPAKREILVTDLPGPPAEICGFVSEEAAKAAEARGYATVSEIGFPADLYLGHFEGADSWQLAMCVAYARAEELGYEMRTVDSQFPESDFGEGEEDWEEFESDTEYCAEIYYGDGEVNDE